MGYLYQDIMNVPGLSGSAGDRQQQLYEKMGSPQGPYTGSYDQNIWLYNQIQNGNTGGGAQPVQSTAPTSGSGTPAQTASQQLTDKLGAYLAPQKAYSDVVSFDTANKPYQALYNTFANSATNEFNTNTYNPFLESQGNTNAANNAFGMGNAQNLTNIADRQQQIPFQNQLANVQQQLNTASRGLYNQNLSDYYNAPNAFTNLNNPNQLTNTIGSAQPTGPIQPANNRLAAISGLNPLNPNQTLNKV